MNAYTDRITYETHDALFRCSYGHHGTHRSLSALWELFHGTAAMHPEVLAAPFLQSNE
jgi:hypothetical protein